MRAVLTMAMKDLRLISRDYMGLFFIVIFPIVMGLFFGQIMGPIDTKKASFEIAIVDEDGSPESKKLIEELRATGNLQIEVSDRNDAMNRVRQGKLVGMIVLPKGCGEAAGMPWVKGPAIQIGIDPSRSAESGMLQGLIMQSVGKQMAARFKDPTAMRSLVSKSQHQIEESKNLSPIVRPLMMQMMGSVDASLKLWAEAQAAEEKDGGKPQAKMPEFQMARIETIDVPREIPEGSTATLMRQLHSKWDISFPQSTMWGILACAAGFAITIVRERKQGTLMRLQVAPVSRTQVLLSKATACFLAVLGVIAMMVVVGTFLGMRPNNYVALIIAALCIAFCFVGIMMLMSVIGKTEESVSGAAWSANMLMAMFGGGMVPLVFMPPFMKTASTLSPVKWSILSLEGAIWRGFSMSEMAVPCTVLVGVGAVCLMIGARVLSRAAN